MEREKLNIDQNGLFEELKKNFASEAKTDKVCLLVIPLIFVILIGVRLYPEFDASKTLFFTLLWIGTVAFNLCIFIWNNKLGKANTAQHLLDTYDQSMKRKKWIAICYLALIAIIVICAVAFNIHLYKYKVLLAVLSCFLLALFCYPIEHKSKIKRLRELVQNS